MAARQPIQPYVRAAGNKLRHWKPTPTSLALCGRPAPRPDDMTLPECRRCAQAAATGARPPGGHKPVSAHAGIWSAEPKGDDR